jgi:hypothetical protein
MIWTLAKFWEDLCVITLKHTVRKTYLRNNGALMQTFSLPCFSSSNRVGGVAHDCVKTASKSLFPDYKAPFCFRSVVFSHPEWVASYFNKNRAARNRGLWGSEEDERSDRPTDTNRKTADFEADFSLCPFDDKFWTFTDRDKALRSIRRLNKNVPVYVGVLSSVLPTKIG